MTTRTMPQHMQALAKANGTKRIAEGVKLDLFHGRIDLIEALLHPALQGYRLRKVLLWLPRCGPVNSHKLLNAADMLPWRIEAPLGRLTQRERTELCRAERRRREAMEARRA